jgi:DNA-binding NarL/FixJ family response regulator
MIERTRVLIAHAPTLLRECLATALSGQESVELVGEVPSAAELLDRAGQVAADVVLLDLDMPSGGIGLLGELRQAAPKSQVLVLTRNDAGLAAEVMKAGAHGYLDYNCGLHELVRCIERVSTGDVVVIASPPSDPGSVEEQNRDSGYASLTPRERDVLELVVEGRTNADIASALCITNHTVKGHLGNILNKLALQNRVQLTAYAMQHGFGQVIREPVRLAS